MYINLFHNKAGQYHPYSFRSYGRKNYPRDPKHTEMRYIKQANFFFEITKFYDRHNCDVKIENNHIHRLIKFIDFEM